MASSDARFRCRPVRSLQVHGTRSSAAIAVLEDLSSQPRRRDHSHRYVRGSDSHVSWRLFAFLVLGHGRRRFEVTRHPTAEWLARHVTHGKASVTCRASHSAVGCRVTSNRRRPWPSTRKANNRSNMTVGTTHISMAAIASAWLCRNLFQDCDGGINPRCMYLETVDWAKSNPSIRSSPWIRAHPQGIFPAHPSDEITQAKIDLRSPCPIPRLPAPVSHEARTMPSQDRLRLHHLSQIE